MWIDSTVWDVNCNMSAMEHALAVYQGLFEDTLFKNAEDEYEPDPTEGYDEYNDWQPDPDEGYDEWYDWQPEPDEGYEEWFELNRPDLADDPQDHEKAVFRVSADPLGAGRVRAMLKSLII